ncbi:MAG: hypothetical protein IJX51_04005 [Clostridia bacterium]|nr:hypothetical protein [Clostridia bacterium]
MKILSFGEIIWDIYPDKSCIGGAPLNFSAHTAKRGADSYLLSSVGDDDLGREALLWLDRFGVKRELVSTIKDMPTGKCRVSLDKMGIPKYIMEENTAYDSIELTGEVLSSHFDALSFGTLALRNDKNRHSIAEMLEKHIADTVFCDLNLRYPFYTEDTVRFALENTNILKINDIELNYLRSEILNSRELDYFCILQRLCSEYKSIEIIILTYGEKGAYVYSASDGKIIYRQAKKADVISTVGAGDSFGAVFLTEYLFGKELETCLDSAICVSAQVVSHKEAVPLDI